VVTAFFRRGATRSLPDRDLDRLAERYGALLVVRFGIAITVLVVASLATSVIGIGVNVVAPVTGAYLVFAILAEAARRRGKWRIDIQSVMQVVDVAYIALIMAPTGGPKSQLIFLFYVHLIAVTLLGNHRTGLRMALIDSLVFVLLYSFALNTAVSRLLGTTSGRANQPPTSAVVLSIVAFWLIAGCTSFYSWVNERELRRSKEELEALALLSSALERTTCPEQIMQVLLERSVAAFGFSRGAALLSLPDGTTAMSTVRDLPGEEATPVVAQSVRPDVVVERAWAERGPVLVRALDPVLDSTLDRLLPEARNVVVLPLTAEGEPLGALAVERGGLFGVKLPVRAVTMLNQRLAKEDSLTGLANRRVFEEVLAREVSRSRRNHQPLSLVVFDVDHFKRVNDTLGHQAGDDVLRQVAAVLAGAARDIDLVARYGGEEFTVVLPDCSLADAVQVAERMRSCLSGNLRTGGVTLSAGVAEIPSNAVDEESLIAAADEAMYTSKRTGRDRTTRSTRRGPQVFAAPR
jgi:diguanylate cyclase (GGDEF)-like protein